MDILRLASKWGFDSIRSHAIGVMETVFDDQDPLDRIFLAIQCNVPGWVHSAYVTLCEREAGLSADDIERLGPARAAAIFQIREALLQMQIDDGAAHGQDTCHKCPRPDQVKRKVTRFLSDGRQVETATPTAAEMVWHTPVLRNE